MASSMSTATIKSPKPVTTFPAARMKTTKSIKSSGNATDDSLEDEAPATNVVEQAANGQAEEEAQVEPAPPCEMTTEPDDPVVANELSLNVSTAESTAKVVAKRDPLKPSSNFTPIERTFILMAIAAVRSDPKWRKHSTETWSIKDFTVPFCNAVREKLNEDPDFKGRVAVASATPDRDGKYRQSPSKESIRKIWSNLYLKGCITRDLTNLGRKKDLAAEERVKQFIEQNQDSKISSRAIAAQTNTSKRNVIRILHQEHLIVRKSRLRRPGETPKRQVRRTPKKTAPEQDD